MLSVVNDASDVMGELNEHGMYQKRLAITAGDVKQFFGRLKDMPMSLIRLRRCHDLETESVLSGKSRTQSMQSGISASIDAFLNDMAGTPQRTPQASPKHSPRKGPLMNQISKTMTVGSSFSNSHLLLPSGGSEGRMQGLAEGLATRQVEELNMRNTNNPSTEFLGDIAVLNGWREVITQEGDLVDIEEDIFGEASASKDVVNHYFQLFVSETTFEDSNVDWETLNEMGIEACREYVYQGEYRRRTSFKSLKSQWLMQKDKPYQSSANVLQAFAEFYNSDLDNVPVTPPDSPSPGPSSNNKLPASASAASAMTAGTSLLNFPERMNTQETVLAEGEGDEMEGDDEREDDAGEEGEPISRRASTGAQSAISAAMIEKTPKTPASSSAAGSVSGRRRL